MNELAIIPSEYGIEERQASELYGNLPQLKEERAVLETQFNEVIKMDIESPETWQQARELRLLIQKNRTKGIEVWHKNAKDFFLKGGQFVDAIKRKEIDVNKRMEDALTEIEKYEQIQEEKRLAELQNQRVRELIPYVENAAELDLSGMEFDVWEAYFQTKKKAYEDEQKRIEEERKAEELKQAKLKLHNDRKNSILDLWQFVPDHIKVMDFSDETLDFEDFVEELKIAKEKHESEQEAIRKENERLQKEAEKKKKLYEVRSSKLNGLWATMPEKYANVSYIEMSDPDFSTMLREATEAKLKQELADKKAKEEEEAKQSEIEAERKRIADQEARLLAEKEEAERKLREAQEAEERAKAEEELRLQAELNKGDAEKVKDLISDLQGLKEKYTFKSQKNKKMYQDVKYLLDKVVKHIESK